MSEYYNGKRTRNVYLPGSSEPFKLSRSKLDLFLNCPRCFYLDRRLGIAQPPGYPFNLNTAVDTLLKKEFDIHRAGNTTHPLMKVYGLDLVPFQHEMMDEWRENFKGVQYLHKQTNLLITGAIDDLWVDKDGLLYIVDYKATSKSTEVNLDADWQIGYKRQMEIYQWLMRANGFKVSNTGYFVYCNGKTDREAFDGKLEFDIKIISYTGNDNWVEKAIVEAHQCLMSDEIPKARLDCDFCVYRQTAWVAENPAGTAVPAPKPEKIYYSFPCPKCGAKKVQRYVYGYIDDPKVLGPKEIPGGCCIEPGSPKWRCDACGHEWGVLGKSY